MTIDSHQPPPLAAERNATGRRGRTIGLAVVAVVATGYGAARWSGLLGNDGLAQIEVPPVRAGQDPDATTVAASGGDAGTRETGAGSVRSTTTAVDRSQVLARARRSCELADLDAFVDEQTARCVRLDEDDAPRERRARARRVLAEGLYERVLARDLRLGFQIGGFVGRGSDAVRVANQADLTAAEAALARAEELGDRTAELERLRAGLMTCRLTGIGAALKLQGKISESLQRAHERDAENGHVHIALGCKLLFVPSWLGQNPEKALEHFAYAHRVQPLNERPAVFAAFAEYLRDRPEGAMEWLERAVERNPDNPFARVVLARLRAGEDQPFERDVESAN